MTKPVRKPLAPSSSPADIVLACYFGQPTPARELTKAYRALRVGTAEFQMFSRLQAAVATVALKSVRRELPQWAAVSDGKLNTRENPRSSEAETDSR